MAKKLKNAVTDYWACTIVAAVLIGTSLQVALSTVSTQYITFFHSNDLNGENYGSLPNDFLYSQLITAGVGILLGVVFLLIRKPKK